jgi:nucleoside-diphosphate-sugar epimerase
MTKKAFITGASGCVGHYLVESLINKTDYELFLLVRDRQKLKVDINSRAGINVIEGTMQDLAQYQELLGTMHYVVSTAAAWGGTEVTFDTNLHKSLKYSVQEILFISIYIIFISLNEINFFKKLSTNR